MSSDDREDVRPEADNQFGPVREDYDYESAAEDWDDDLGEAEATLNAIREESSGTEETRVVLEGSFETIGHEGYPRHYLFREPGSTTPIVQALVTGNHYALVAQVVAEPTMSHDRWENQHNDMEQEKLWAMCCDFIRAEELVNPQIIQQAEKRRAESA